MAAPRPEKVAVVTEVRLRLAACDAALLTEYRGLDVAAMATLRRGLRAAGGEYKIYKNSLVRLAAADLGLGIGQMLVGPTAIAFVVPGPDGSPGDAAAVAKVLRDFARTERGLVLKGGVLAGRVLDADDLRALAELPARAVMLALLAGVFQAPMTKFARLLQAVPLGFAHGLQALIDSRGGVPEGGAPGTTETRNEPTTAEEKGA